MALIFNGITRQIEVTDPSIYNLDAGREIYSEWKRWQQLNTTNGGYAPAFRTFGGDSTAPGQNAPKYYFLQNFWTVFINNGNVVNIAINLYSDNFITPYIVAPGSGVSDRNSDAVSINNETIEYSSFNGGVTIDQTNSTGRATTGILFPTGTEKQPSDNLNDLHTISLERGFNKVYVKSDLLLGNQTSWVGHEFTGESALKTTITIEPDANVFNCEFYECTLTGTLDGNSQIERGVISGLNFVDGYIFNCAIGPVEITLGTFTVANIFDCFSTVPGQHEPIINMNKTGIIGMRGYKGSMLFKNYNGTASHTIGGTEGNFILDNTITSGVFVFRGTGYVLDTNGKKLTSTHIYDDDGNLISVNLWNGGVTIINERVIPNQNNEGDTVWTEQEKLDIISDVSITKDQSEISAIHAVEELN